MKMDAYECLVTRRSIRRFTNEPIPIEYIEKILYAGIHAPSSKHIQPWYIIADTTNRKNLVASAMEEHEDPSDWNPLHPTKGLFNGTNNSRLISSSGMREAPLAIQVFSDHPFSGGIDLISELHANQEHRRHIVSYSVEIASLSACVENMLLASHSFGLGGFWCIDPTCISETIKKIYNQPDRDYFTTVCIGFPNEDPKPKKRKKKFEILSSS
ncbi:MAG: nitroreductase family protein [Candidatus Woesearchaeota archaeon]